MPRVSFVIPCYRQARFLPAAVRSALAQTIQDIEVVIVDDGSPDDPLSHLGDLVRDPRVIYFAQENRGLPEARNTGIRKSTGAFLNFLDADDWVDPEFCRRLERALTDGDHVGFAYCDLEHAYEPDASAAPEKGGYSVGQSRRTVNGNILSSLLLGGYFPPAAALVPRVVLDRVGLFDPDLGGHADWDLWLRISAAGFEARYIDEELVHYRLHADNMSRQAEHMQLTRAQALRKLFRESPDAAADAIHELCRSNEEQFAGNLVLRQQLAGMEAQIAWLRETKDALERSVRSWQAEAERLRDLEFRYDQDMRDARGWISRLEEARRWDGQLAVQLKQEASRAAEYFRESQAWIASLQEAKDWQEKQAIHWRQEAERLQRTPYGRAANAITRFALRLRSRRKTS